MSMVALPSAIPAVGVSVRNRAIAVVRRAWLSDQPEQCARQQADPKPEHEDGARVREAVEKGLKAAQGVLTLTSKGELNVCDASGLHVSHDAQYVPRS